jgi:hypothetical protein
MGVISLFGGLIVETSSLISCYKACFLWHLRVALAAIALVVASVLLYFGGGLVASFVSVQFFFSFLLFVLGSLSINACPTCSCRWLFGEKNNNFQ